MERLGNKKTSNQNEEMETRLALLESLVQTKNKDIESYQKRILDYTRLQQEYMSSQHKLIKLQEEFSKISKENEELTTQIKLLHIRDSKPATKTTYIQTRGLKIIAKGTQTSEDDFQKAAYKWHYGKTSTEDNNGANDFDNENCKPMKNTESERIRTENDSASQLVTEVTAAASEIARKQFLASMVYEKTSGLYYDYKTGYYFDAERSLFYDGNRLVSYYNAGLSVCYILFHSNLLCITNVDTSYFSF